MNYQRDIKAPARALALPSLVLLFGVVFPMVGSLAAGALLPDWSWSHIPFHATVEATGGLLALVLTAILMVSQETERRAHYLWVSASLVAMGILDIGHSAVSPGEAFVWFHSTATLLGGILIALVWLPVRIADSPRSRLLVPGTAAVSLALVGYSLIFPILIPAMTIDGGFTVTAQILNILGGIGFLIAGAWFLGRHRNTQKWDDGLFAFLCILFGLAGLLFDYSSLWDAPWWWWHLLRLVAYGLVITYAMATFRNALIDRKLAEEELQESEQIFSSIVTSSPMGIYTYQLGDDDQLILVGTNPAADRISGVESLRFIGKTIEEAFPDLAETEAPERYRRAARHGEAWFTEQVHHAEGGIVGAFEVHAFQMSPGKAAIMLNDITHRKRAQETLAEQKVVLERTNEELKTRNAELDEFTYVASHDLQEPLRKLTSFCGLLEKDLGGDLPPRAQTDMDFITDAAKRMQRLIQDLLSLSRAGRSAMKRDVISLRDCAERAIEALGAAIEDTGAVITLHELPEIWGDPTMITQLYQNLIGNSLKFMKEGARPEIQLTFEEDNGEAVLGVRDNGIGIETRFAKQIFAPFKRLHGQGEYKGSGIGLAICRKTVERHGGRLWVESEDGAGSHFRFSLEQRKLDR